MGCLTSSPSCRVQSIEEIEGTEQKSQEDFGVRATPQVLKLCTEFVSSRFFSHFQKFRSAHIISQVRPLVLEPPPEKKDPMSLSVKS